MKITALIIEDEARSARYLKKQLEKEGVECVAILDSVESSLLWFETNEHPQIVFSDIELGDGLSFDIYNQVEVKSKIIFTTAYSEYSIQAFKHNSIDYLLKPIKNADLLFALNQFKKSTDTLINTEKLEIKSYKNVFLHKIGQHLKTIQVNDIAYLFSENKLVYFVLKNGEKIITDFTIELIKKELNPTVFFQINRQMMVHKNAIKDILVLSSTRYQLKLNPEYQTSVYISRDSIKNFKTWLEGSIISQ